MGRKTRARVLGHAEEKEIRRAPCVNFLLRCTFIKDIGRRKLKRAGGVPQHACVAVKWNVRRPQRDTCDGCLSPMLVEAFAFPIKAALPDPPQLCNRSWDAPHSLEHSCFKQMPFTKPIQVSTFFTGVKCFFNRWDLHREPNTDLLLQVQFAEHLSLL